MLTRRQKIVRASLLGAFAAALLWGTASGNDVHFPFGPFRMYSTSTRGHIDVLEFHAVTTDGEKIKLPSSAFGLRRAEFEGLRPRIIEEPELMDDVVASYERVRPDGSELAELRMVHVVYELVDGRPVWTQNRLLASWER